ncbi:hypothetical protein MSSAC_2762 [Methanosarcina siciliae C2J]|uniref:Uncharacterized protein n=1 Tax=Methanosarcina siciliae C2J TaxID=1434118 RepID=A0A0E3PNX2_9EURY|nr:hypothetical protein [Methanosarcina siciliae]AKB37352.1 hypothetical protein MSSAC_2762 [Methanosarcina siciliae C2J]
MKIGDIDLPCVTVFNATSVKRTTETISPLGTNLHTVAEFEPDPVTLEMSGSLFKEFSGTKTADQYAEDLAALASRKSIWNYIHNVQGQYGFVSASSCNVDPRERTKAFRDFSIDGLFLPLSEYWGRVETHPVVLQNDFGITLEDCQSWTTLPAGSSYATSGSTREVDSEYGSLVQTSGSFANFMPAGNMDGIGEVQVYDGSLRIHSAAHRVSGILTVKNGLYSLAIDKDQGTISVSYWSGSEYTLIDDFSVDDFTFLSLRICRPYMVEVILSTGAEVLLEAGRPPRIATGTLTCSELSPSDSSTDTENFLFMDAVLYSTGLYVASDQDLEISDGVISGPGKKWIFKADIFAADAVQEAMNCLVDGQAEWYVSKRW